MKKALILMSDTGGGHRATAEALRNAFVERHPKHFEIELADLLTKHALLPVDRVSKTYRFVVNDIPWLYKFAYQVGGRPQVLEPVMRTAARLLHPYVSNMLDQYAPDLVISVHPLMQEIPRKVMARRQPRVPFMTVVTDLVTMAPVWFDPGVTLCFVPSEEAYGLALHAGLQPEQLRQFGLPIRSAFARPPRSKEALRRERGMATELPVALIVSGGEGMGPVGEIAEAVAARLAHGPDGRPRGQLVVICGRNNRLRSDLEERDFPAPVTVLGFVEDIWEWMAASDCIVTKAGPGTIAEALALGLPIVLSGYIPGQESGNVPYVLKHGVGVYTEVPGQIAEVIDGWFGAQRDVLEQLAQRASRLGRPDAAARIVDEIARLVEQRPAAVDGGEDVSFGEPEQG
jgi:1,2-diacylglycerol 3-beta-galactosyltransferase